MKLANVYENKTYAVGAYISDIDAKQSYLPGMRSCIVNDTHTFINLRYYLIERRMH